MKKLLISIAFCLAAFSAVAEGNGSHSLDYTAMVGFKYGPAWAGTITFNKLYPVYENFRIGWGAGLCVGQPMLTYMTTIREVPSPTTTYEREMITEMDLPLYCRLNYGEGNVYFNLDLGFALGLIGVAVKEGELGGVEPGVHYSGLFAEPQVGYHFSNRYSVAVGVLFQYATYGEDTRTYSNDVIKVDHVTSRSFLPALTLRLVRHF